MRIAIDATPLLLRSAGVKTYLYNWTRHLRRLAGNRDVLVFPGIGPIGEYSHERSVLGAAPTVLRLAFLAAVNYSGLPLLDWMGSRVDVFHASNQMWNPPRRARLTTTVYDMTCRLFPELHPRRNVMGAEQFAARVVRRADGLIAISESTKADVVRILGLPDERIEVIYPGVAEEFFQVTPETVCAARQRYSLARPYVLFVGTIEPRKNIETLLDAWAGLKPSIRQEVELILAGPVGWASRPSVERVRSASKGVRYLGYILEEDLPAITAGAAVFVYASLYEGFGLPLAQAMAAGVPAVTSNVSSMPEVAGDGALLVDPRSAAELAAAMERLLLSEELRRRVAENGSRRARVFTWENCARASWTFFERICGAAVA